MGADGVVQRRQEESDDYCTAVRRGGLGAEHERYHDTEYGFPLETDTELFGRLVLEINQAGLSWTTILNKQDISHRAYGGYDFDVWRGSVMRTRRG